MSPNHAFTSRRSSSCPTRDAAIVIEGGVSGLSMALRLPQRPFGTKSKTRRGEAHRLANSTTLPLAQPRRRIGLPEILVSSAPSLRDTQHHRCGAEPLSEVVLAPPTAVRAAAPA